MDDMISRAAAINALGEEPPVWYDGEDEIAERNQWRRDVAAIKALSSAQPGWIPVTERLPKDDTEVIVSCTDDSGDDEFSYVTTGWHYKGLWVVNNDRCYFVRAWQPLPAKPWEGEQDERM